MPPRRRPASSRAVHPPRGGCEFFSRTGAGAGPGAARPRKPRRAGRLDSSGPPCGDAAMGAGAYCFCTSTPFGSSPGFSTVSTTRRLRNSSSSFRSFVSGRDSP